VERLTVELTAAENEELEAQARLKELEPRLFFAPKLPACVLLSIVASWGSGAAKGELFTLEWRLWEAGPRRGTE